MKQLCAVVFVCLFACRLSAQGPGRVGLTSRPSQMMLNAVPTHSALVDSTADRSHWAAGMVIGGLIGLVVGVEVQNGFGSSCEGQHCGGGVWFLIPTFVFAIVGGFIGSGSH